jgi:hypothetical protein
VPYQQALLLKEKLGDKNELVSIEGGGHWRFSDGEHKDIKIKIDNFLEKNVQKN